MAIQGKSWDAFYFIFFSLFYFFFFFLFGRQSVGIDGLAIEGSTLLPNMAF
jgi:hypothetical protein